MNYDVHFAGHSGGLVTCLSVPAASQYLITGSDDASVVLWNMKSLSMTLLVRYVVFLF